MARLRVPLVGALGRLSAGTDGPGSASEAHSMAHHTTSTCCWTAPECLVPQQGSTAITSRPGNHQQGSG